MCGHAARDRVCEIELAEHRGRGVRGDVPRLTHARSWATSSQDDERKTVGCGVSVPRFLTNRSGGGPVRRHARSERSDRSHQTTARFRSDTLRGTPSDSARQNEPDLASRGSVRSRRVRYPYRCLNLSTWGRPRAAVFCGVLRCRFVTEVCEPPDGLVGARRQCRLALTRKSTTNRSVSAPSTDRRTDRKHRTHPRVKAIGDVNASTRVAATNSGRSSVHSRRQCGARGLGNANCGASTIRTIGCPVCSHIVFLRLCRRGSYLRPDCGWQRVLLGPR